MSAHTEVAYRSQNNLEETRRFLCQLLEHAIKGLGISSYCIGFHVRHVLDTSHNLVEIASSDPTDALSIRRSTEGVGLQTLNHVLDSLYYETDRAQDDAVVVPLSFCLHTEDQCEHMFDEIRKPLRDWKGYMEVVADNILQDRVQAKLSTSFPDLKTTAFQGGVNWDCLVQPNLNRRGGGFGVLEVLFGEAVIDSQLWNGYLCGVQKLCHRFGIEPSILSFQSIMAAIYQLGLYAHRFGRETVTIVVRPKDHFGFVVGFTLISNTRLRPEQIADLTAILGDAGSALKLGEAPESWSESWDPPPFKKFKGLAYDEEQLPSVVVDVAKPIAERVFSKVDGVRWLPDLGTGFDQPARKNHGVPLWRTVASFLKYCINFCDERFEGRGLRFGLVLGNPKLLKHWPGPAPLPLGEVNSKKTVFYDPETAADYFHLSEGPQHRAIVIPYMQDTISRNDPVPAYVIDLEDFEESLSGRLRNCLWPPELRPYIFLTKRYPWAVASVVGPGSEIRVFVEGNMVLYRDGKGWKTHRDIDAEIARGCARWGDGKPSVCLMKSLIELAIQMSPITRPESHGGLILYAEGGDESAFWTDMDKKIKGLRFKNEPPRVESEALEDKFGWLRGLDLMRERPRPQGGPDQAEDSTCIDSNVARLALRASSVDGALIFCGPRGRVRGYGKQVIFDDSIMEQVSGTKTSTAATFAKLAGKEEVKALAISVSADGPVKVFWPDSKAVRGFGQGIIFGEV